MPCGHVACYSCLKLWFLNPPKSDSASEHDAEPLDNSEGETNANANGPAAPTATRNMIHVKKHCPHCRHIVNDRPVPVYVLRDLVDIVEPDVPLEETGPPSDMWKDIFPEPTNNPFRNIPSEVAVDMVMNRVMLTLAEGRPTNRNSPEPFYDREDGVTRCGVCMHEIWGLRCSNEQCGRQAYPGGIFDGLSDLSDVDDDHESSYIEDEDSESGTDTPFINDASETLSEEDTYCLPEIDEDNSPRREQSSGRGRPPLRSADNEGEDEGGDESYSDRPSEASVAESDDFLPPSRTRRRFMAFHDLPDGDEDDRFTSDRSSADLYNGMPFSDRDPHGDTEDSETHPSRTHHYRRRLIPSDDDDERDEDDTEDDDFWEPPSRGRRCPRLISSEDDGLDEEDTEEDDFLEPSPSRGRRCQRWMSEDDERDEEGIEEDGFLGLSSSRGCHRQRLIPSEDDGRDEEDTEEDDFLKPSPSRVRRHRHRLIPSEDDERDEEDTEKDGSSEPPPSRARRRRRRLVSSGDGGRNGEDTEGNSFLGPPQSHARRILKSPEGDGQNGDDTEEDGPLETPPSAGRHPRRKSMFSDGEEESEERIVKSDDDKVEEDDAGEDEDSEPVRPRLIRRRTNACSHRQRYRRRKT